MRTSSEWQLALREAVLSLAIGAAISTSVFVYNAQVFLPELVPFLDGSSDRVISPGADLLPVSVGDFRKENDKLIIQRFNNDEALFFLPKRFRAEDYPFIKLNIEGLTRFTSLKLLWRLDNGASDTHAVPTVRDGDGVLQIPMPLAGDQYRGQVQDIALLFYEKAAPDFTNNHGQPITVNSIELIPFSKASLMGQVIADWSTPPVFRGLSVNLVTGVHRLHILPPNLAINVVLACSIFVAILVRITLLMARRPLPTNNFASTAVCLAFIGFAFIDLLRWQWRIEQTIDTHDRFEGKNLSQRITSSELRCGRFPDDCVSHLLPYF